MCSWSLLAVALPDRFQTTWQRSALSRRWAWISCCKRTSYTGSMRQGSGLACVLLISILGAAAGIATFCPPCYDAVRRGSVDGRFEAACPGLVGYVQRLLAAAFYLWTASANVLQHWRSWMFRHAMASMQQALSIPSLIPSCEFLQLVIRTYDDAVNSVATLLCWSSVSIATITLHWNTLDSTAGSARQQELQQGCSVLSK
jgi:hypothetical protein